MKKDTERLSLFFGLLIFIVRSRGISHPWQTFSRAPDLPNSKKLFVYVLFKLLLLVLFVFVNDGSKTILLSSKFQLKCGRNHEKFHADNMVFD